MYNKRNLMRTLADALTASRLVIAAGIVGIGIPWGRSALNLVQIATLLGWTADTVDGHLARRAPKGRRTWISNHDRTVDAFMVLAGFLYMTAIGFVSWWFCLGYLAVSAGLIYRFRSITLATLLEAPLVIQMPVVALREVPSLGLAWLVWGLLALILDRKRLAVRLRILWDDWQRMRS
jgi:phosphatidylglycerophosphate synthase